MDEAFGENGNLVMQMGMQYGQRLVKEGERGFMRYLPTGDLRRYFRVSNEYVKRKLGILVFPFRHEFSRQVFSLSESPTTVGSDSGSESTLSPMEDVNVPDLYVPLMALVTYVTLSGFAKGLRHERLQPQDLAATLSTALLLAAIEVVCAKIAAAALYLPPIFNYLDLIALSCYKFVGVCIVLVLRALALPPWPVWLLTAYVAATVAFFTFRSLQELASRDGRVLRRAVLMAYSAAALQVPMVFFYCKE